MLSLGTYPAATLGTPLHRTLGMASTGTRALLHGRVQKGAMGSIWTLRNSLDRLDLILEQTIWALAVF